MKLDWKTCFKISVSVFLLYVCISILPVVSQTFFAIIGAAIPLIAGCVIAYILNILMTFYEKHYFPTSKNTAVVKSRRAVCLVGAFVTLLAIIVIITILIVPQLISCVKLIFNQLPGTLKSMVVFIDKWDVLPENVMNVLNSIDWKSKIGQIIEIVTSGFSNVMDVVMKAASSVFSGVVTVLIGIIFSLYILTGKEKLAFQSKKLAKKYVSEKWYTRVSHVICVLDECFHRYIVGQCTEAVILGLLCTVGMFILRLPYATMIGALVAFTALIPVAGAYIGAIVGGFMILTVSPIKALVFLVFLIVLQQIEGNLIYPKVVGSSIGLPGIWVLAAVTVGGGVMGIWGMLLGVPLAAAVYKLLSEDVNKNPSVKREDSNENY